MTNMELSVQIYVKLQTLPKRTSLLVRATMSDRPRLHVVLELCKYRMYAA